jgi:hypothetical protein
MKDAVKITVIATGFKDGETRRRHRETTPSFVVPRQTDDYREPEPEFDPEPPPPPPMVMEQAAPQAGGAAAEVVSLDSMRNAMIANFEQEDLDVPAFLRKRSEPI